MGHIAGDAARHLRHAAQHGAAPLQRRASVRARLRYGTMKLARAPPDLSVWVT